MIPRFGPGSFNLVRVDEGERFQAMIEVHEQEEIPLPRILIVDDEPDFLRFLCLHFERQGHRVRVAGSVKDAIRLAEEFAPEILIADWMLGESMDGVDVCTYLRRRDSKLRTVLMTGRVDPPDFPMVAERVVDRRLDKPFFLEKLDTLLSELDVEQREGG